MLKKTLVILGVATMLMTPATFAEDWQFLGTFSAPVNYDYTHDPLILDHLSKIRGNFGGNRRYFNVYYYHSHAGDQGNENEYVSWARINVSGKVVPLDNKTMKEKAESGIYNAYVVSNIEISNKGAFGVMPKRFAVYDSATHEVLLDASGQMKSDNLWTASAAEYIVNITGPHPHWHGGIFGINHR